MMDFAIMCSLCEPSAFCIQQRARVIVAEERPAHSILLIDGFTGPQ